MACTSSRVILNCVRFGPRAVSSFVESTMNLSLWSFFIEADLSLDNHALALRQAGLELLSLP